MSKGLSRDRHDQPAVHELRQTPANQASMAAVDNASPSKTMTPAPVTPP
jgi:hypothetical protein